MTGKGFVNAGIDKMNLSKSDVWLWSQWTTNRHKQTQILKNTKETASLCCRWNKRSKKQVHIIKSYDDSSTEHYNKIKNKEYHQWYIMHLSVNCPNNGFPHTTILNTGIYSWLW